jgi:hypothetical protein
MPPLPLGQALLDDLGTAMDPEEIARYLEDYSGVTGYDVAFHQLLQSAGGKLGLEEPAHRAAVVNWLRTWGCRHLRRAGDTEAADALSSWWESWGRRLPAASTAITDLDDDELTVVEQAFDELRALRVSGVGIGDREIEVVLGDTAASKTFFAVRPSTFLPWDDPTRLAFGWWGGGRAYADLLRQAGRALAQLADRLAVPVRDLPPQLGRPASTPPKLVDEFLWVRISREI